MVYVTNISPPQPLQPVVHNSTPLQIKGEEFCRVMLYLLETNQEEKAKELNEEYLDLLEELISDRIATSWLLVGKAFFNIFSVWSTSGQECEEHHKSAQGSLLAIFNLGPEENDPHLLKGLYHLGQLSLTDNLYQVYIDSISAQFHLDQLDDKHWISIYKALHTLKRAEFGDIPGGFLVNLDLTLPIITQFWVFYHQACTLTILQAQTHKSVNEDLFFAVSQAIRCAHEIQNTLGLDFTNKIEDLLNIDIELPIR